jgi:aminoglycoside phosphotransferase (APT) family kinase protein
MTARNERIAVGRRDNGAHPNHRSVASLPAELRRAGVPHAVREWVRRELGARVVAAHRLAGASSTAVHVLVLSDGRRVVLRRYAWPGFLEDEPIAVQREVDALEFARSEGLPAPELLAADVDGHNVGDGIPVVVMKRLPGRPSRTVDVLRLAETAATLHDIAPSGFAHRYFRWFDDVAYRVPRNATDPALWQWAVDVWARPLPPFGPVFIHRDFHPGNVLWLRRRVSGVVDWANACVGPAACDVSTCRGDLMRIAGPAVADAFAAAYRAVTGCDLDPYWEVVGVLEHGPSPWSNDAIAVSEYRLRAARRAYDQ